MGEACPPRRSILCGGGSTYVHASTRSRLVIDFDDLSKPCSSPKSVLRSMITSRTPSPLLIQKRAVEPGTRAISVLPQAPLLRASPRSRPHPFIHRWRRFRLDFPFFCFLLVPLGCWEMFRSQYCFPFFLCLCCDLFSLLSLDLFPSNGKGHMVYVDGDGGDGVLVTAWSSQSMIVTGFVLEDGHPCNFT